MKKTNLIGKRINDSVVVDYDDNGIVVRDSNGYERYIEDSLDYGLKAIIKLNSKLINIDNCNYLKEFNAFVLNCNEQFNAYLYDRNPENSSNKIRATVKLEKVLIRYCTKEKMSMQEYKSKFTPLLKNGCFKLQQNSDEIRLYLEKDFYEKDTNKLITLGEEHFTTIFGHKEPIKFGGLYYQVVGLKIVLIYPEISKVKELMSKEDKENNKTFYNLKKRMDTDAELWKIIEKIDKNNFSNVSEEKYVKLVRQTLNSECFKKIKIADDSLIYRLSNVIKKILYNLMNSKLENEFNKFESEIYNLYEVLKKENGTTSEEENQSNNVYIPQKETKEDRFWGFDSTNKLNDSESEDDDDGYDDEDDDDYDDEEDDGYDDEDDDDYDDEEDDDYDDEDDDDYDDYDYDYNDYNYDDDLPIIEDFSLPKEEFYIVEEAWDEDYVVDEVENYIRDYLSDEYGTHLWYDFEFKIESDKVLVYNVEAEYPDSYDHDNWKAPSGYDWCEDEDEFDRYCESEDF